MFEYAISKHAMARMDQRGVRDEDLELVLSCGTEIAPDAWLIRQADADREIAELKRRIQRIERLKNKKLKVVAEGNTVITCYPSGRSDQQKISRRRRAA